MDLYHSQRASKGRECVVLLACSMTMTSECDPPHAKPPRLCFACLDVLYERIRDGHQESGYHFCNHRGVLALFAVEGQSIKHWSLRAPMTEEQAQEYIRDLIIDPPSPFFADTPSVN